MVVLRLKRLGRRHRPFYRLSAMDRRSPRNGRVIEELGWFDPIAPDDKQLSFNVERIDYWLSVGAQPTEKVSTLIKKYGTNGTRLDEQKVALERSKLRPQAPPPIPIPKPKKEEPVESPPAEAAESSEGAGDRSAAPAPDDSEAKPAAE